MMSSQHGYWVQISGTFSLYSQFCASIQTRFVQVVLLFLTDRHLCERQDLKPDGPAVTSQSQNSLGQTIMTCRVYWTKSVKVKKVSISITIWAQFQTPSIPCLPEALKFIGTDLQYSLCCNAQLVLLMLHAIYGPLYPSSNSVGRIFFYRSLLG